MFKIMAYDISSRFKARQPAGVRYLLDVHGSLSKLSVATAQTTNDIEKRDVAGRVFPRPLPEVFSGRDRVSSSLIGQSAPFRTDSVVNYGDRKDCSRENRGRCQLQFIEIFSRQAGGRERSCATTMGGLGREGFGVSTLIHIWQYSD